MYAVQSELLTKVDVVDVLAPAKIVLTVFCTDFRSGGSFSAGARHLLTGAILPVDQPRIRFRQLTIIVSADARKLKLNF